MILQVQTSKGNYLTPLSVRIEQVDLTDEEPWHRCMDDLILKAAIWQDGVCKKEDSNDDVDIIYDNYNNYR
jgi:hypothetical protein